MDAAIGIDIGGTNSVFGYVDRQGRILAEGVLPTKQYADPAAFVEALADRMRRAAESMPEDAQLAGIGIGAPNGNYYRGTIEFAPNLAWEGIVPLAKMLEETMQAPAVLTNDANAAAIGEMVYGDAKGLKDFLLVTLGTGLGSGFVANGALIYGHDGFAGELGHTIVDPNGRACGCGRLGCLETYVSAPGIVRTVRDLLAESNTASALREADTGALTSKQIAEAALDGDPIALWAFEKTGEIFGRKLADTVAITSPAAIFLFGGLARSGALILEPTRRAMEETLLPIYRNKVRIELSALNDKNAAVLGAAALVWAERAKDEG